MIARIALVVVLFAVTLPAHPTASTPPPSAPLPLTRTLDPARYAGEGAVCDLLTDGQASALGLPRPADTNAIEGDVARQCVRSCRA